MSPWRSIVLLAFLLSSCSMPRIIVLNDPLDARQHNDLGVSYELRGELDLAQREYRRAAELDGKWSLPLFNLGNVHARRAEWSKAIDAYEAALRIAPQSPEILNNLAWALVEDGKTRKGVEIAEQAIKLDGTNPSYWDTLAAAYLAAGNPNAANRAACKGLSYNPPEALRQSLQEKLLEHKKASPSP